MKKKNKDQIRFNWLMLVLTAIAAIFVGGGVYALHEKLFYGGMAGVLVIPICFGIFILAMGLIIFLLSNIFGYFRANITTGGKDKGKVLLILFVVVLTSMLLMAGLEFLYELDFTSGKVDLDASTFVFIVDDSGSMYGNDPQSQRYAAIKSILEGKPDDTKFAIYAYSNETVVLQPITTVGAGIPDITYMDGGGTYTLAALDTVYNDFSSGKLPSDGNPAVVLLTDGESHDILLLSDADNTLAGYASKSIPVHCIGFGNPNMEELKYIAKGTGGQAMRIRNANQLRNAIDTVLTGGSRTLLSDRFELVYSVPHGIMRVLFLAIFSMLVGVTSMFAYGCSKSCKPILIGSAVTGLLGGLLQEMGMQSNADPAGVTGATFLLLGLLFALIVPSTYEEPKKGESRSIGGRGHSSGSSDDFFGSDDSFGFGSDKGSRSDSFDTDDFFEDDTPSSRSRGKKKKKGSSRDTDMDDFF